MPSSTPARGLLGPARLAGLIALVMAMPAQAQRMPISEMPGASDHPLISRYSGSVLQASAGPLFQELEIPTGPLESTSRGWRLKQAVQASGPLSAHFYVAPQERSALEVFRSHEKALKAGGFKLLYQCEMKGFDSAGVVSFLRPLRVTPSARPMRGRPWSHWRGRRAPGRRPASSPSNATGALPIAALRPRAEAGAQSGRCPACVRRADSWWVSAPACSR